MINTLARGLFSLCALLTLSTGSATATTTWNFTGTCSDCPDIGEGVLTATPSGLVTAFSFTYTSDWITYSMTSPTVWVDNVLFTGLGFTLLPGQSLSLMQSAVPILSFGGAGNPLSAGTHTMDHQFYLGTDGFWSTGPPLDFGTNGAFTLASSGVPEPSTLGLAGISASLLLLGQWRRRKD